MKLSDNMRKAIASLKEHGEITVTYWGSSVFAMSVRGNDRTLKALFNRGLVTRKQISNNTVKYELTEQGKSV